MNELLWRGGLSERRIAPLGREALLYYFSGTSSCLLLLIAGDIFDTVNPGF
jgi:hypothetical protein